MIPKFALRLPRARANFGIGTLAVVTLYAMLNLRVLYFEDLTVGMVETLSKTISSSDVVGFAQLTGDRNPIHLSEHFAAKTSFGREPRMPRFQR